MANNISRTVTRQYTHQINMLKGGPVNARLEYTAFVQGGTSHVVINQGSLVSLNTDGKFVAGLDASGLAMPMWSKKNEVDPDVTTGSNYADSIVGGRITAFVATGAFELETTEFVAGTYAANNYLTAATGANAGKVTVFSTASGYTPTTGAVVGVVSSGVKNDQYGFGRLAFWPVFMPKVTA